MGEVVFSSSQFPFFSQRPFFKQRVVLYSRKFIFVEHVFLGKQFFQLLTKGHMNKIQKHVCDQMFALFQ